MGGKVLRCAGAALLAWLFLAATTAGGQAFATDQHANFFADAAELGPSFGQTQGAIAPGQTVEAFHFLRAVALIPVGDFGPAAGCEPWAENPRAEALYPCAALRRPEGPRFHLLDARSGAGELPDAPMPSAASSAAVNAAPADQTVPYTPITARGRVVWVVKSTLWPQHLAAGVITTGIATARDKPPEDGPHWAGFGERYGVRLTSVAVNHTIEASLGSLWGEDPRYFRVPEQSFGGRVKNVIKMTFLARRTDGRVAPAYALFIGTTGGNFLS